MVLPEKSYEIRFKRKDQRPEEVQQYTSLPEAREILRLFDEPISGELYTPGNPQRIRLAKERKQSC